MSSGNPIASFMNYTHNRPLLKFASDIAGQPSHLSKHTYAICKRRYDGEICDDMLNQWAATGFLKFLLAIFLLFATF